MNCFSNNNLVKFYCKIENNKLKQLLEKNKEIIEYN